MSRESVAFRSSQQNEVIRVIFTTCLCKRPVQIAYVFVNSGTCLVLRQRCGDLSSMALGTPSTTLDDFLREITRFVREKDATRLREYLVVEPPYAEAYHNIISELRRVYTKDQEHALETKCGGVLQGAGLLLDRDAVPWTAFTKFMVQYFCFLRDVDVGNLLETYNMLSELLQYVVHSR